MAQAEQTDQQGAVDSQSAAASRRTTRTQTLVSFYVVVRFCLLTCCFSDCFVVLLVAKEVCLDRNLVFRLFTFLLQ